MPPATRTRLRRALVRLARNLGAGARLALLRPVRAGAFRIGSGQIVALFLVAIGASMAASWAMADAPRVFDASALHGETLGLLLVLALAVAARGWGHPAPTPLLVGGMLAAYPALTLAVGGLWVGAMTLDFESFGYQTAIWAAVFGLAIGWVTYVAGRVLSLFDGRDRPRWALLAMAYVALAAGADWAVPTSEWWYTDWSAFEAESEAEEDPVDAEALFYAQPDLLAAAGRGLEGERPGVTDLYFLGFGADASQSVFLREVRYVRDLFDRRFDTAARSLALVNHRDTTDSLPLATTINLERSLAAIGDRMDPAEDVLFLFLTGHGSREHELAVRFAPLPLNRLGPERIAEAIEAAGIRYRVVVVSACYSGGFLDALADEDSMVLTAAAADRTSFGCSEEAEFTYFGRAFFHEALEETRSFREAFASASAAIEEREAAEDRTASKPQIHVGAGVARRLARLETRLDEADGTRVAEAGGSGAAERR